MKKKFAVFDIDWTLHQSALGTDFLVQLSRDGVVPIDLEEHYTNWRSYPIETRAAYFKEHFMPIYDVRMKGIDRTLLEKTGQRIAQLAFDAIDPFMREEIEKWRAENYFLLAITTSPAVAVGPLIEFLGFDTYQSSNFEYDEAGRFVQPKYRSDKERDKGNILKRLVKQHDLTWKESVGYGDSLDDIAMLDLVDAPVAVNPNGQLRTKAEQEGWRIIDLEKSGF